MRDPLSWSLPLGRLFGITIRVHVFFLMVAAGLILRWGFQTETEMLPPPHHVPAGAWVDEAMLMILLFLSVLVHEFGHCFGVRLSDGDAHEMILWPLGGLGPVEVPHTPRANFITAATGPLVSLLICLVCAVFLSVAHERGFRPPWASSTGTPFAWWPLRVDDSGAIRLLTWDGTQVETASIGIALLARLFYVNWLLFWVNVVLIGFPMDGGRMFQCLLWPRLGFHQATVTTIYVGFVFSIVVAIFAIFINELLPLGLAMFMSLTCWRQYIILVTGGEDSLLGYDFSQGYTSLEREQPAPPRRRRPNVLQRWLQRRAARKLLREQEQREAEEQRMDELLEKVQREGLHALTDEERRFLKRVSDRYRNRQ